MLRAVLDKGGDLYRRMVGAAKPHFERGRAYGDERMREFGRGYDRTGGGGGVVEGAGRMSRSGMERGRQAGAWTRENPIKAGGIATAGAIGGALPFMVGGDGPDEELMAEYERLVESGQFRGSFEDFVEVVMGGMA